MAGRGDQAPTAGEHAGPAERPQLTEAEGHVQATDLISRLQQGAAIRIFGDLHTKLLKDRRVAALPKPVQLELLTYAFLDSYPGQTWEDEKLPPPGAIGVSDKGGAWLCGRSHAAGRFYHAYKRSTCAACGNPKEDRCKTFGWDLPFNSGSSNKHEQGWAVYQFEKDAWPKQEPDATTIQGDRSPRSFNKPALDVRRTMQREGYFKELDHCRLLLDVTYSPHVSRYQESKPYMAYAVVRDLVQHVELYEQDDDFPTGLVLDLPLKDYMCPDNWIARWKDRILPMLRKVDAANWRFMQTHGYVGVYSAFSLFVCATLMENNVNKALDKLGKKNALAAHPNYFTVTRALLEKSPRPEGGLMCILAYCRYVRIEQRDKWKSLEDAWGVEIAE
jgi:ribosomal protein L37E